MKRLSAKWLGSIKTGSFSYRSFHFMTAATPDHSRSKNSTSKAGEESKVHGKSGKPSLRGGGRRCRG